MLFLEFFLVLKKLRVSFFTLWNTKKRYLKLNLLQYCTSFFRFFMTSIGSFKAWYFKSWVHPNCTECTICTYRSIIRKKHVPDIAKIIFTVWISSPINFAITAIRLTSKYRTFNLFCVEWKTKIIFIDTCWKIVSQNTDFICIFK